MFKSIAFSPAVAIVMIIGGAAAIAAAPPSVERIALPEGRLPTEGHLLTSMIKNDGTEVGPEGVPLPIPIEFRSRAMPIVWRKRIEAEGYWSPEYFFKKGVEPIDLTFELLPAGKIEGRLAAPEGAELPEWIALRFELPTRAYSRCPVDEARFSCLVPAMELEPRLHIEGFVSPELPKIKVEEGKTLDLGTLELRPAAIPSISFKESEGDLIGRVLTAYGTAPGVRIAPSVAALSAEGESVFKDLPEVVSGPGGVFRFKPPEGTEWVKLTVMPSDYAFKSMQAKWVEEKPRWLVPLSEGWGTLVIGRGEATPADADLFEGRVLKQQGVVVELEHLLEWAETYGRRDPAGGELAIPRMDPGKYTLCRLETGDRGRCETDCRSGMLEAGGELRLDAP